MEYPPFKVSVHCFTFNQAKYIVNTLDGFCMQQTSFPFVCCIVDDASTDGEQEVIRKYIENNFDLLEGADCFQRETDYAFITYTQHKTNKNCCFAILFLKVNHHNIKKNKTTYLTEWDSQAKYLALCEGDDYWTDANKLQKQVDFLESHPEYSMCFHRAEIQYEAIKGVRVLCDQVETREYSPNELYQNWYVPTASIVCRKECYDVPLVEREKLVNGDVVLMLKCASLGKIYGFADSMSVYRVHSTGVTYDKSRQKYFAQRFPDHYKCIKKNFPFLDKKVANARISHGYYVRAVHPNNILTCLRDLFLAFCYSPAEFMRSILNAINKRTK